MPPSLPYTLLQFSLSQLSISWRKLVAVVTAVTFALLLSAALSHHHESALETQDCFACTAAVHQLSLTNFVVKLQQLVTTFLYQAPSGVQVVGDFDTSTCILPPSCGPPSSSSFT